MDDRIDWIIPSLRKSSSSLFWHIASCVTVTAVGLFSKIFISWCNKPKMYNCEVLNNAVSNRPKNIPLITISNHHSCFDDPSLWSLLSWRTLFCSKRMRWGMAAHDICFTNSYHSYFFMFGKCVPVVRGRGVFQEAVNYCIDLLKKGEWLHVFPEGKVNMEKSFLRFKWGIGRMIYESPVIPIIVPIWHIGMDDVLPNYPPYYPRTGKKITFNVGEPIDLTSVITKLRKEHATEPVARKIITDILQAEMYRLKDETESLHKNR